MDLKRHIPNFLTCCNLFCGCIGIVEIFNGNLVAATYMVWVAAVLDFFDGFAARILNISSKLGKELDSLADMVTFGLLPAVMMFSMIDDSSDVEWLPYAGFLIAIFSALRLAKFNIDDRQSDTFIGLPTPANALFITSIPFVLKQQDNIFSEILSIDISLILITLIFSYLMVAEIKLIALKFHDFKWGNNKLKYSLIVASLILLGFLTFRAIPLIIITYILLSLLDGISKKKTV